MSKAMATRDAYGDALVELGQKDQRIVVLDADVGSSTRVKQFAQKFPERFFQVGIAEQNMVGIAAGLAASGKIPFVSTFAIFSTARVADQIRNSLAYPGLNVKLAATHAGITVGADGATHQALEDIGIIRSIPQTTIIVPADYYEAKAAVKAAAEREGLVYLRFTRGKVPVLFDESYNFSWGKVSKLADGEDVTIFATGVMVAEALAARKELEAEGINAEVINVHTIKPLEVEGVVNSVRKTGACVTAEEHNIYGGLGSAVAEVLVENYPVPMARVGVEDTFGRSGKPDELMEYYGLTAKRIVEKARAVIEKK